MFFLTTFLESVSLVSVPWYRRLNQALRALFGQPALPAAKVFCREADSKAFSTFIMDPRWSLRVITDGLKRCAEAALAAISTSHALFPVFHDTTELNWGGKRLGLFPLHGSTNAAKSGMLLHASLLTVPQSGSAWMPVTLSHVETLVRSPKATAKASKAKAKHEVVVKSASEALRWTRGVEATNELLEGYRQRALHIADCEADNFAVFAAASEKGHHFIIRAKHSRKLLDAAGATSKLEETIDLEAGVDMAELHLPQRKPSDKPAKNKAHPPRQARRAKIKIGWHEVTLARPAKASRNLPTTMTLRLVWVREDPQTIPAGEKGIDWHLLTSLDVPDEAAAREVVANYRKRWMIEDYFKVFKVGTAVEARQHETRETLERMIGLLLVVAMAMFRSLKAWRESPEAAAETVFDEETIEVLKLIDVSSKPKQLRNFAQLTVEQVLIAIARLGGYKSSSKPPGMLVIWRGFWELDRAKHAIRAASKQPTNGRNPPNH